MDYEKLTEKQKRFIDYYIQCGNGTEACRLAGYEGNNLNRVANENLSKLDFYIKQRLESKHDERIATADEILRYLTSVVRGQIDEECVAIEGIGKGFSRALLIKKEVSPKDRNKAAETLAKIFKLYDRKTDDDDKQKDDGFLDALNNEAERVWEDED